MANVLNPEKQEQIRALGRLGWSLRRIEEASAAINADILDSGRRVLDTSAIGAGSEAHSVAHRG